MQPLDPPGIYPLELRASLCSTRFHPIFPHFISFEVCHEGPVLPEVGEGPSPRLQGRSPPWQGLRDLQVEPAFQGSSALISISASSGVPCDTEGRRTAAFRVSDAPDLTIRAYRHAKP